MPSTSSVSRHPAKPRFASDVDTKKVGTVRRTSSVSKDKEDFRKQYIIMTTAVVQLNRNPASSPVAREHSVRLARNNFESQEARVANDRALINSISTNPTTNPEAIELRSELASHLYNSPTGFREMVETSQAPTDETDLLSKWLQDYLPSLDGSSASNKIISAMHRMLKVDSTKTSRELASLMKTSSTSGRLEQALKAAGKTDILLAKMQDFVEPRAKAIGANTQNRTFQAKSLAQAV